MTALMSIYQQNAPVGLYVIIRTDIFVEKLYEN